MQFEYIFFLTMSTDDSLGSCGDDDDDDDVTKTLD